MTSRDVITRYLGGEPLGKFTAAELAELGPRVMQTNAYRDAKHPDHEAVSRDARQIFEMAHPGTVGAGGELVSGGTMPSTSGLFR